MQQGLAPELEGIPPSGIGHDAQDGPRMHTGTKKYQTERQVIHSIPDRMAQNRLVMEPLAVDAVEPGRSQGVIPLGRGHPWVFPRKHLEAGLFCRGLHVRPFEKAVRHARRQQHHHGGPRLRLDRAHQQTVTFKPGRFTHRIPVIQTFSRSFRRCATGNQRQTPQEKQKPIHGSTTRKKPHVLSHMGPCVRNAAKETYLPARVPTTSTSTRRFLARPSRVPLSATGWDSPLPSV